MIVQFMLLMMRWRDWTGWRCSLLLRIERFRIHVFCFVNHGL